MPSATPLPDSAIPKNPPNLSNQLPKLTPRRRPQAEQQPSNPPPSTPALPGPPNLENHAFVTPSRRILSERDHNTFLESDTYNLIVSFVFTLSDCVRQKTVSDVKKSDAAADPTILALLAVLNDADDILKQCPPLDTGSRFGNPVFRSFLSEIEKKQESWHETLGVKDAAATS